MKPSFIIKCYRACACVLSLTLLGACAPRAAEGTPVPSTSPAQEPTPAPFTTAGPSPAPESDPAPAQAEPEETPQAGVSAAATDAMLRSGFNVLAQLYVKQDIVFSPLSLNMALGMLSEGAKGDTRQGILKAMGYEAPEADATAQLRGLAGFLTSQFNPVITPDQFALELANALYIDNHYTVSNEYKNTMQHAYNAAAQSLDFSSQAEKQTINDWVKEATHGHIESIGAENFDPSMLMALLSTLYFKAGWVDTFSGMGAQDFTREDGTKTQLEMMALTAEIPYAKTESCQAAASPLFTGDPQYSMLFIRPNDDITLSQFMEGFTAEQYTALMQALEPGLGTLTAPVFTVENTLALNDALQALGMTSAFQNADFTGIDPSGGLFVSQVTQQARIDVAEQGVEASAVTIIGLAKGAFLEEQPAFELTLDKPFFYCIYETSTHTPLFMGAYCASGE